jgi:hypothetical protein
MGRSAIELDDSVIPGRATREPGSQASETISGFPDAQLRI